MRISLSRCLLPRSDGCFIQGFRRSISTTTDMTYAIGVIRDHDPAGYLPGRLLPDATMSTAYYSVRCFWVETGLRFGSTARVAPNATPADHLEWWQKGIDVIFEESSNSGGRLPLEWDHPSLRLLFGCLRKDIDWTKDYFDQILEGRRSDLNIKQYETIDELIRHAEKSCGNLSELVLLSGGIRPETNPVAHEAARRIGICHGLTNALRTSIPVMSTTGRLIVPADLTKKYGVRSPRYLLSALGQGDEKCVQALRFTIQHIAQIANENLAEARRLRDQIMAEPAGSKAVAVLLPGLASETFLKRLESHDFQLTDRNLRNIGLIDRGMCSLRMILGYLRRQY